MSIVQLISVNTRLSLLLPIGALFAYSNMPISCNLGSDLRPSEVQTAEVLFTFRLTSASGLGAFSLGVIPKDTVILTLPGPYASVIMRKWRKEVCAWCYKWRYAPVPAVISPLTFETSAALNGDLSKTLENQLHREKKNQNTFIPGLWCCSSSCHVSWIRDFELWEGEEGLWVANVLEGFEKVLGESIRQEREKRSEKSDQVCMVSPVSDGEKVSTREQPDVSKYLLKDMADVDIVASQITPEFLDHVWSEVETLLKSVSGSKSWTTTAEWKIRGEQPVPVSLTASPPIPNVDPLPTLPLSDSIRPHNASGSRPNMKLQRAQDSRTKQPVPILNELELDTARFVLDGMIRKVVEGFRISSESQESCNSELPNLPRPVPHLVRSNMSNPGLWKDFMLLQDNELAYFRSKPYMLAAGIKIYAFLKRMLWSLSEQSGRSQSGQFNRQEGEEERRRRRALEMFCSDLDNFEVVRAILGRDPGNVFGIWEEGEGEESEMYGWGAYVFGSFFNHGK